MWPSDLRISTSLTRLDEYNGISSWDLTVSSLVNMVEALWLPLPLKNAGVGVASMFFF